MQSLTILYLYPSLVALLHSSWKHSPLYLWSTFRVRPFQICFTLKLETVILRKKRILLVWILKLLYNFQYYVTVCERNRYIKTKILTNKVFSSLLYAYFEIFWNISIFILKMISSNVLFHPLNNCFFCLLLHPTLYRQFLWIFSCRKCFNMICFWLIFVLDQRKYDLAMWLH